MGKSAKSTYASAPGMAQGTAQVKNQHLMGEAEYHIQPLLNKPDRDESRLPVIFMASESEAIYRGNITPEWLVCNFVYTSGDDLPGWVARGGLQSLYFLVRAVHGFHKDILYFSFYDSWMMICVLHGFNIVHQNNI